MGSEIAVVTDSTAYLPPDLADRHGLIVVPLQVAVGGAVRDEGDLSSAEAARALREWHPVTTSRPAPERFTRACLDVASAGAREIVSVHLSAAMSGWRRRGSRRVAPVPVRVVDSRTTGLGLGFADLSAAATAMRGGGAREAGSAAIRRAELTRSLIYVDTLEHLRRGGRIGAAATLLGSALMVKPLLDIRDGRVAPLEKVRTSSRALARLGELAPAVARLGPPRRAGATRGARETRGQRVIHSHGK